MKSVFTLNTHIEGALSVARINVEQLVNAVQASLNSASQTKEENRRGNVKLVKADDGTRGGDFRFSESSTTQYTGRTDNPAKFARWHDAQARVFKVCGEPEGFTVDAIPASLFAWVNDKFGPDAKSKGKAAKRNGNIESVETPGAPA